MNDILGHQDDEDVSVYNVKHKPHFSKQLAKSIKCNNGIRKSYKNVRRNQSHSNDLRQLWSSRDLSNYLRNKE